MADVKLKAGTPQVLEANGGSTANAAVGTANDADFDNTTTLAMFADFELNAGFGSSVTAGEDLELYLVPKLDGTNAADVDTSTPRFQPSHFAGMLITPTTETAARRMTVSGVSVGPFKYTAYVWNRSGQTMSAGWTLTAYPVLVQN